MQPITTKNMAKRQNFKTEQTVHFNEDYNTGTINFKN